MKELSEWERALLAADIDRLEKRIAAYIERPNEDGTACSADRAVLADRIRRGEHWK